MHNKTGQRKDKHVYVCEFFFKYTFIKKKKKDINLIKIYETAIIITTTIRKCVFLKYIDFNKTQYKAKSITYKKDTYIYFYILILN